MRDEIRKLQELMETADYVTDAPIATSVHLAMRLRKPLLIEGPAGVGKTEVAKVMARMLGTNLIRLQCYEGLDASTALYEWNYQKQLLHIKLEEAGHNNRSMDEKEHEIFSEPFLLRRPLLQAITQESQAPVLLVDETDRCDEEFEAFMLEVFSDWQVTIPEIGTIKATHPPHVILTSNRTRERSDGAVSISGSTIRRPTRRSESSRARCRGSTSGSRVRSRSSWRRCGRCGSPRCRAWPRRSTGPRRSRRCTRITSTSR